MPNLSCKQFADVIARNVEHLDEDIIREVSPLMGWIGDVETGRWRTEDGVSHTYDRFPRVYPDMSKAWTDVIAQSCIGQPCGRDEVLIGLGYQRDSYKLQSIQYGTGLFCWDLELSADKAKAQFAWFVEILRDASSLITSNRFRNEAFRICGSSAAGARDPVLSKCWCCMADGSLEPMTFTETGDMINIAPVSANTGAAILPGSRLTNRMIQRRYSNQMLNGALGRSPQTTGMKMTVITGIEDFNWMSDDSNMLDHWRFNGFAEGDEIYKYGFTGSIGMANIKVDPHQMRFQDTGGASINRVFPYRNIAATAGIRGIVNEAYINAPYAVSFIWHRRAMLCRVRDTGQINPQMPFAARDFAGRWGWATHDLVCRRTLNSGEVINEAVDNSVGNQGKFYADFHIGTEKQYIEWAEAFLHLTEPACSVGAGRCAATPDYVAQYYSSANYNCTTGDEDDPCLQPNPPVNCPPPDQPNPPPLP